MELAPKGVELAPPKPRAQRGEEDFFELASRRNHQIEVTLYWLKQSNILGILLRNHDRRTQAIFPVPNDQGLEAFYHPYAYIGDTEERPLRRRRDDETEG